MSTLNQNANRVLQEFGGRIPANLLQFEDARREFLSVRALEMQKLGIADTDKTVVSKVLSGSSRNGSLSSFGDMTPAFVEFSYSNQTGIHRVEIVPVEAIPEYEGGMAIAFVGNKYRTSFDFWNQGTITVWYDPIEDLMFVGGDNEVPFAAAFITYLVKQAAFNLCGVMMLNLALNSAPEEDERMKMIINLLQSFQNTLALQVARWEREFKKYVNAPLNSQTHLRDTNDAISARSYGNTRRNTPLDYIG